MNLSLKLKAKADVGISARIQKNLTLSLGCR